MSHHIPDVTKMIGETPRTDQQNDDLLNSDSYTSWLEISGFARQLERELNAANERIKRLEKAGDALLNSHHPLTEGNWQKAKEAKPCIKQLKTKSCIYCMKVECECSDFDVSADMGAKG